MSGALDLIRRGYEDGVGGGGRERERQLRWDRLKRPWEWGKAARIWCSCPAAAPPREPGAGLTERGRACRAACSAHSAAHTSAANTSGLGPRAPHRACASSGPWTGPAPDAVRACPGPHIRSECVRTAPDGGRASVCAARCCGCPTGCRSGFFSFWGRPLGQASKQEEAGLSVTGCPQNGSPLPESNE